MTSDDEIRALIEQLAALLAMNKTGRVSHSLPGLAVELLQHSQSALSALLEERDAIEAKAVALFWACKGDALVGDVQELRKRAERLQSSEARITDLEAKLAKAREDSDRLDFLDQCNANLNAHYGTKYRWEMVMNHNVNRLMTGRHLDVDLNDAKAHGFHSCRDAIDREMMRVSASRRARSTLEVLNAED